MLAGGSVHRGGDRESLPGLRLIELAATLEPNDTVPVEYRRGQGAEDRLRGYRRRADDRVPGPAGRRFAFRYRAGRSAAECAGRGRMCTGAPFLYGSPLADLELAPLNPDLGQYFGTTSGVLVISAPKDSELGLKGGDVVLAVDGRKPESPSHLLRILRSYEEGESFKMDILRNRKRETVSGRLGSDRRRLVVAPCVRPLTDAGAESRVYLRSTLEGNYGIPVDLDHRIGRWGYRQASDARAGSGRDHRHHADRCGWRPAGRIPRPGPRLVR